MKWCVGRTLHLHASRKFGKINPLLPCEFNGDEVEYLDVFTAFRGFDAVYSFHQLTLDIYSYRHATKDMIRIHKLNGNPDPILTCNRGPLSGYTFPTTANWPLYLRHGRDGTRRGRGNQSDYQSCSLLQTPKMAIYTIRWEALAEIPFLVTKFQPKVKSSPIQVTIIHHLCRVQLHSPSTVLRSTRTSN